MQTKYDEAIRRMASRENVGHGHVFPRADGIRMRCGGSRICAECAKDNALATAASSTSMHADLKALAVAADAAFTDLIIAQGNMRDAAKHDKRWEGCAEEIQPRIDALRAALARVKSLQDQGKVEKPY